MDYSAADGLLTVERSYKSHGRNPLYVFTPLEIPGFAPLWHGVLPGVIDVEGDESTLFAYLAPNGTVRRFFALSSANPYSFALYDQTRLKMSMVSTPSTGRAAYFQGAADTASTGELQLDFANGDRILFRRSGTFDTANKRRLLVPVQFRHADGYTQWFDYPDAGIYPNLVRDSFGRQLALTWSELGWVHNTVRGSHKGPNQATDPAGFTREKGIAKIDLPDGTTLNYGYGAVDQSGYLGRLETVKRKNAAGDVLWGRTYLYEDQRFTAAMTGILDQNGARLSTYAYDAFGRATSTERAGGVDHQQVVYSDPKADGTPDVRTVTNALGLHTVYTYSGFNPQPSELGDRPDSDRTPRRLLTVEVQPTTQVAASTSTVGYTNTGQTNDFLDPKQNESSQSFEAEPLRPDTVTDASGVTRKLTWHPTFDLPTRVLLQGRLATDYSYTAIGQVQSITETDQTPANLGASRTTTFEWQTGGRLKSVNGPRNPANFNGQDDLTQFTYDAAGNRRTMTDAMGHVTHYDDYDANGNPKEMTDANGVVTKFSYDPLGRPKTRTVKDLGGDPVQDAVTTFDYDIEGRVTGLTLPGTLTLSFDYDLAGRLKVVRTTDGERIDFAYDGMSNLTSRTVKRGDGAQSQSLTRVFDEMGRMLTQTLGPFRTTEWRYDSNGNPTKRTTGRGIVSIRGFDALDRLVSDATPDAGTKIVEFDAQDNVKNATDGIQLTTQFERNGFGEVIKETSPDRGVTTFTYDDAGDLRSRTDARNVTVTYDHDVLGRLTHKVPSDNAANAVTYDWDVASTEPSYPVGRISKMTDITGSTSFEYDHRGNMVAQRWQPLGSTSIFALRYIYDRANRITRITYPSGRWVRYTRDEKGRLLSVKANPSATGPTTLVASDLVYEPFGPLKSMNLGNGLRAEIDWGSDGQLVSRKLYRTAGGTVLSELNYSWEYDGNLKKISDVLDMSKRQRYYYDGADRLSRIDLYDGAVREIDYANDNNGNRLSVISRAAIDGPAVSTDTYNYASGTNRLASIVSAAGTRTYGYDVRGNTTSENRPGPTLLSTMYDGYGRLSSYIRSDAAPFAFTYNGRDDRVTMTRGIDTRRFVYDPDGRVIGEYGLTPSDVKAEFIWLAPAVGEDNPFGGAEGTGGYAPLAVATPSSLGVIQLNWVYGNHLGVPIVTTDGTGNSATTANDYLAPGFPGQSRVLADLYYNRYRDYDPVTGRYIQADPIGVAGGRNPYLYVAGNPVVGIDPWGLEEINAFPYDQNNMRDAADRAYKNLPADIRESYYHFFGHGNPNQFCPYFSGTCLDADQFIDWMIDNHYTLNRPIMIWACQTGKGKNSFAEQLSKLLHDRVVVAPDNLTWWSPSEGYTGVYGAKWVGPQLTKDFNQHGGWRIFGGRN